MTTEWELADSSSLAHTMPDWVWPVAKEYRPGGGSDEIPDFL